jgi:hypothetical protein
MTGRRWLAIGVLALGLGLAVNSLLGPFVADVIDYPLSETLINQTIGLDAYSLLIATPLATIAALLALRGHPAAPAVIVGLSGYAAYMLVQYLVGPAWREIPGVLSLQLALLVLAGWLGLGGWTALRGQALPERQDRRSAFILLGFAAFVVLRYLPTLAGSITGEPIPEESRADPTMYWLIVVLDLTAIVPATIASAIGLLREASWARAAAHAVAAWFAVTTPSIAGMAVTMLIRDDQYASAGVTVLLVVAAAVYVAFAVWLLRPLFQSTSSAARSV